MSGADGIAENSEKRDVMVAGMTPQRRRANHAQEHSDSFNGVLPAVGHRGQGVGTRILKMCLSGLRECGIDV